MNTKKNWNIDYNQRNQKWINAIAEKQDKKKKKKKQNI